MTQNRLKNFSPHLFLDFGKLHTYPKAIVILKSLNFFFQSGLQRNNNFFYERTQMCIYGNLVKFSKKGDNFDQINFESILV